MKTYVLLIALLFQAQNSFSQVADDFSDGDFTHNPKWEGDTGKFEINAAGQLHLLSSGADTSFLSTPNLRIDRTEWSFWVKLSFNTSSNNNARVYLVSDEKNLTDPLNGYFLQIGGSNDSVEFMKQTGTVVEKLFRGVFSCLNHSTNTFRFKMIHDSTGRWTLYTDTNGGLNYTEEGHCMDTGIQNPSWFGIYCRYTSSNASKFYFDDFYVGPIRVDTVPPVVDSILLINDTTMKIAFNENVLPASALDIHHYFSKTNGTPLLAVIDPPDGEKVVLTFKQPFPGELSDTLIIYGIQDMEGNTMTETAIPFSNYKVKLRDIIMDEIMADPDPDNGLPASEYVELYNRTRFPVNLEGWIFDYGSSSKTFPKVIIDPHGYLILTKGIVLNYFGRCVDLFTSGSTLSNEGSTLVLRDASGKIIHAVKYSMDWYHDPLKENGGWSLEMMDTENPCGCLNNWSASTDKKGGTPGRINSVSKPNPDLTLPYVKGTLVTSDTTLHIFFSESMDSLSLSNANLWNLDDNGINLEISAIPPMFNSACIRLPEALERNHIYSLSCRNPPSDCAGNLLDTLHPVMAGRQDSIIPGDIIINEILANPSTDGVKFVELYNCSDKIINLKELALGSFDTTQNGAANLKPLSESGILSFPGNYSVLTTDPNDIQGRYYTPERAAFIQMSSFPSLDRENGTVVLARNNDGTLIDRVSYSSRMYSDLLTSTEGVSIERLNPLLASGDIANWHSASENCGFATPGYLNSEFLRIDTCRDEVRLVPQVFTPDDDGKEDVLLVSLNLNEPGLLANITIFDASGNRIRSLARNRLLSTDDGIIWDGKDDKNQKSPMGIYIFYIELFKPDGKIRQVKKTCILGGKR